jgi:tRNA A37 threonylcarbamoyladenosine dehydratase
MKAKAKQSRPWGISVADATMTLQKPLTPALWKWLGEADRKVSSFECVVSQQEAGAKQEVKDD